MTEDSGQVFNQSGGIRWLELEFGRDPLGKKSPDTALKHQRFYSTVSPRVEK